MLRFPVRSVSVFRKNDAERSLHRFSRILEWNTTKDRVVGILYNPAEGDDNRIGPTVGKLLKFFQDDARFGSMELINLYSWISKDPNMPRLYVMSDTHVENLQYVRAALENPKTKLVIAGWGGKANLKDVREREVFEEVKKHGPVYCFHVNQDGSPRHPCARGFRLSTIVPFPLCETS